MPSLVSLDKALLPDDLISKLGHLDNELSEGDITEKGYCRRKWMLLEPYAESSLCDQISSLQKRLESTKLPESEYFKEMRQLLDVIKNSKLEVNESEPSTSDNETQAVQLVDDKSPNEPKSNGRTPNKRSSRTRDQQPTVAEMFSKNLSETDIKNGDENRSVEKSDDMEAELVDSGVNELPEKKRKIDDDDDHDKCDHNGKENGSKVDVIIKKEEENTDDNDSFNSQPEKKAKLDLPSKNSFKSPTSTDGKGSTPEKCKICHQLLSDSDTIIYSGHPNGAVEEYVALTDPRLLLFNGTESDINEHDERPQNKITYFSVYDKEGHLCPFDSGLVERNVLLYFSGYVKAIYEECADIEGGIPAYDIGPINEWWISGFDGGEKALIGFSTPYGEYYLMQPSKAYEPIMEAVTEKIYMGKLVIEFILDEINPTYEDLLNKLQTTVPPKGLSALTEDSLLRHAQFICDQVQSFDAAASDTGESQLITTPCMRALVKLAGVTFGKRRAMRRTERKELKEKKSEWSKATTTPLVNDVFETFFTEQLDKTNNDKEDLHGPRRRRCGICEACQQPDCGTCAACLDMVKFGGTGRAKQACTRRRCPNMAIQEADDSDNEEEVDNQCLIDESSSQSWASRPRGIRTRSEKKNTIWVGDSIKEETRRTFYSKVRVGDEELSSGDYVLVEPSDSGVAMFIGLIKYMWQENSTKEKYFHAQWMCRGSDTVLGETSDDQELFLLYECEDLPMTAIKSTVTVNSYTPSSEWALEGGKLQNEITSVKGDNDGKTFFFQKRYDCEHCRFEDLQEDLECRRKGMEYRFCSSCERIYLQQKTETPSVDDKLDTVENNKEIYYGVVNWRGEEYRVGSFVFLAPDIFKFRRQTTFTNGGIFSLKKEPKEEKVDEEVYPEYYRKTSDRIKGSNVNTPPPFCIGYISAILTRSREKLIAANDICLRVNKMYRPENTHKGPSLTQQADLNMVYWSDEQKLVNFGDVAGKCYVIFSENLDVSVEDWSAGGPNRFYFTQAYDSTKQVFVDPPSVAMHIGSVGKGKGKGKGKSKIKHEEKKEDRAKPWPSITKPLRCLDVFAGCGGLSHGLHQSGIAESCWAVEKEEAAAHAFRLNNSNATVFTEDCNLLLKMVMNGEDKNEKGQHLPQKGEVELLCGGPPCQGFSGMNRFNSRQYSLFKNSLVVSYLSYCDYYRPRFFILENVRNFVSFKKSMVLKLALRCLIRMGYQCTFGVLQAGNYGVPQTRRRAIILAAAPGEALPLFPEPTHTFNPRTTQLTVMVDDKKFVSNCRWIDCAPKRTITVRDAMSDLPEICNGARCDEMSYNGDPVSHFQRWMRGNQYQPILTDHICKEMAPLVEARIAQIPTKTGSDWRDLPNIVVRLSDGNYTKKLQYTHHDKKNGKSSTGALRGVCTCATGKPCDPMDRQFNTLIPWCLPHTGNRHNHWAGLYGRLEWDGFFSTTVTNPEPMGKQGRVLHPEQTRVVSVRECARSQGFPDTYRFFGSILDKHRQIGNAVPPPMGEAIGYEIRKCVSEVESKNNLPSTDLSSGDSS